MTAPDNSEKLSPEVPKELTAAMQKAVGAVANPSAEQLLQALNPLLERVLNTDCESRSSALDLLTVDALMTRAMELAAEDTELMQRLAESAVRKVAAHANPDSRQ